MMRMMLPAPVQPMIVPEQVHSPCAFSVGVEGACSSTLRVEAGNQYELRCERFEMKGPSGMPLRFSGKGCVCLEMGSSLRAQASTVVVGPAGMVTLKGGVRLQYCKTGQQKSDVNADEVTLVPVSEDRIEIHLSAGLQTERNDGY